MKKSLFSTLSLVGLISVSVAANATSVPLLNANFDSVSKTYVPSYGSGAKLMAVLMNNTVGYVFGNFGDGQSLWGENFTTRWNDGVDVTVPIAASTYYGASAGWIGSVNNYSGYEALGSSYISLKPGAAGVDFSGFMTANQSISQIVPGNVTIQANTRYTLSYLLGTRNATPPASPGYLKGTSVQLTPESSSNIAPANGNWRAQTLVFDTSTPANYGLVGQALTVGFAAGPTGNILVDDVALDASPTVPIRMRGVSTPLVGATTPTFWPILVEGKANVVRIGFSKDISPIAPTQGYPLLPYTNNLAVLDNVLAAAKANNIKIILTAADIYYNDLPNKWTDPAQISTFSNHLAAFWSAMASRYRNDKSIIAFDVLNEPSYSYLGDSVWYNNFFLNAKAAIRAVYPTITLVLESGPWASAGGFPNMVFQSDQYVIYSFHHYTPHSYTHQGIYQYQSYSAIYPGLNSMWGDNPKTWWTIANLSTDMQAAATFKNMHPGARILVGEFGVVRWAPGADQWYSDSISIFEQYGWDWCLNSIGGWNGWSPSYGTNVGSNSVEADGGDRGARWQVISNKWHLNP